MTEHAEPVATVTDLRVTFGSGRSQVAALQGVSLAIDRGEILGVVGESGSGKSLLGLSLLGLLPRTKTIEVSGSVVVAGTDMVSADPKTLRNIRRNHLGAIFQDPMTSLDPTMRVGKQIAESASDKVDPAELLAAVHVPNPDLRVRAYPHELSGGLRQRVMAAMAMSSRPALIIADEPTTALDVTVQAQLLALLADLRADFGCSVLFITHDLGVAAQITDRIAVFHQGSIVELGATSEVLNTPQHPYTRTLLADRLSLDTSLQNGETTKSPTGTSPSDQRRIVLELHQVSKHYATRRGFGKRTALHAVDGVDLQVTAGESISIVGESGSGKSTLLRMMAGLETPDDGRITVDGDVQMVFQDAGASLTPWLTVESLLRERLRRETLTKTEKVTKINEVLALVGLPQSVRGRKPAELSGGQRQRVALARALIIAPAILLCDEPTSALDASLASVVLTFLAEVRARLGLTIVFVTHDLAVARLMGERIVVMAGGRIVESGTAEQVISTPTSDYTRTLIDSVPRLPLDEAS
ncbi:ATP-binding cassette domain-containing protein [Gordonia polyisoprenivorans]|uniref:ATP-binding cassette domain-containing protein n=1 Tax=Gordonia polyisoprenivorans TaxID=84595 RepID=UPI001AD68615|nr:ABC transporter ATP-binding protein [Gordonia polyisoprenivorans]QTI70533.1 ABC transporter ATP-binding protein [Gordonia polyisoprenivorans]